MRRQYGSQALAAGLFSSCALLLGCVNSGDVGVAAQSNPVAIPDAGLPAAGACPAECQAFGLVCHPQRLRCVECLDDRACATGGAPFCDRGRGECTECRVHSDCPRSTPLCNFGHCSVCPDGRDRNGVCDFDPRCSGRDCDIGTPGQRSGRFGADPDDHGFERNPLDAGA
jgi:hypothetical protein